jgi:putative membrane protein insertion efficiency factor
MKKVILLLIKFYQKTISLDHGILSHLYSHSRLCRFHPTCSQYTYEAVDKNGILEGLWLGFKRVIKCHPWNDGGNDPVPEKKR